MLAELFEMADRAAEQRREFLTDEELFELLEPATPDMVAALDAQRSIFVAEWRVGNDDLVRLAYEEMKALERAKDIVGLPHARLPNLNDEIIRFFFCLTLTPDVVSEAIN